MIRTFAAVALTLTLTLAACGSSRDWFQEAQDATTCVEAADLVIDYVNSDDDNGLRGSGTHGYLVDRRDELCV